MRAETVRECSVSSDAQLFRSSFYEQQEQELFYTRSKNIDQSLQTASTIELHSAPRHSKNSDYWQTREELVNGARVAWRNSNRCIGRLHWNTLAVHDYRELTTAKEIFQALVEHLRFSTNNGRIRPLISIFAPQQPMSAGIRIWNSQLIRYAGYRQADGTILGDPANVMLTKIAQMFGWCGKGTQFDILPLIIQMPNERPQWFEWPTQAILEVPISHPTYTWFAELGLKWHVLPVISNMRLEIDGIHYSAAPFSGWYMVTEIGARNFADTNRYNMLPTVARHMGLNTDSNRLLWKDRAMVELNIAVIHSFMKHGVTIVDHHTASQQFMRHIAREKKEGRITPAEWSWIVPPLSSSATAVYHQSYQNVIQTPNFFYQPDPWKTSIARGCPIHG